MKVLVVDDLMIMRRLIANSLSEIGLKDSVSVKSGEEALEAMDKDKFDLVVTDWVMANIDGLQLTLKIREREDTKDIPILMITALDDKDNVIKALNAGVNDYIVKPFTPSILKKKIEKVTNKKDWIIS
ncbi:MAG: response regulator [Candidatus Kapabacteria bacterium]|nr:response regulator [Candidatus Kapabacteria bacterium]